MHTIYLPAALPGVIACPVCGTVVNTDGLGAEQNPHEHLAACYVSDNPNDCYIATDISTLLSTEFQPHIEAYPSIFEEITVRMEYVYSNGCRILAYWRNGQEVIAPWEVKYFGAVAHDLLFSTVNEKLLTEPELRKQYQDAREVDPRLPASYDYVVLTQNPTVAVPPFGGVR